MITYILIVNVCKIEFIIDREMEVYFLFRITNTMEVPVNINFDLFDTYVASILSYRSELWGFSKSENIERIHRY